MSIDLEQGRRIYERWSNHPRAYDAMTRLAFMGRRERLRDRAIELMAIPTGGTVLDLGCGMGPNLDRLAAAVGPGGRVIGLDASDAMLVHARRRVEAAGVGDRIELVEADAAEFRPPADGIDAALAALSLSAVPDREGALDGVVHGLRPGGRLVVFDAVPFRGAWAALNPLIEPLFRRLTNWDASADLPAEMAEAGLVVDLESYNLDSAIIAVGIKP